MLTDRLRKMKRRKIILKSVKVHNLKDISLELPTNELIVFTGVSGSGKSSLAFDTIYVEGQRRYIESLSTFARRYLGNLAKPDALLLDGIPPTIAIEQKSCGKNPRSSVGTMTAIYDYLRVLYARIGEAYCPISQEKVIPTSRKQIAQSIMMREKGSKIIILSPFAKNKKGEFIEEFADLLKKGFSRVRIDKVFYHLGEEIPKLDKSVSHDVDIVIDRISIEEENKNRIIEAIETALDTSEGIVQIFESETEEEILFSEHAYSIKSDRYYPPLEPEDFSFNHPRGMCEGCHGLGEKQEFDLKLIIDEEKSISEDCCEIAGSYNTVKWGNIYDNLARLYKFSIKTPWKNLSDEAKHVFLYGTENKWTRMRFVHPTTGYQWNDYVAWGGAITEAKKRLGEASSEAYRTKMETLMHKQTCPDCKGTRIKPYPAATRLKGMTIGSFCNLMIYEAKQTIESWHFSEKELLIAGELIREITERLTFLTNVGLHYLTLSRTAPTLSGGESQRVRLASQIGFGLVGVAYILDEPSIGLHPRDNHLLLKTLRALVEKGNTVIVVEHDEETMLQGDTLVDIGPYAGVLGGEVIAIGPVEAIMKEERSVTGAYLSGRKEISIPKKRRKISKERIEIKGASHNNLKNVTVSIPLGVLNVVTGVSGSGKSSLVTDILYPAIANALHKASIPVGEHKSITGLENIDKIIAIDQSPIGRTPRSNPATYVKVFDDIRDLFAKLPESLAFGYKVGRFSFNVKEGSCYSCHGMGMTKIDMDFMEDDWVVCEHCKGMRFDQKTLSIRYKEKNIYEVLEMSISEALIFFEDIPQINRKLQFLEDVGLGYIKIGQSATTLSGGEAQRIKLGKELMRPSTGKTLYILDEPTTGLHFHDIHKLIEILQRLVDAKNTVLIIEHNTDLIKVADYIIDLGPEGGNEGGQIIATGTPEELAKLSTPTGKVLQEVLYPKKKTFQKYAHVNTEPSKTISVKHASQNNLKDVSLEIPRGQISVFTGPSGSGKSSLAFETIYAEGQRRYIDSLSTYAKQFVEQMPKAKVEEIDGLSPAISIEQRKHSGNPRSTLGTMTEVYDYLRIIYARMGKAHCPETGEEIKSITEDFVADQIMALPEGSKVQILSPIASKRGEEFSVLQSRLQSQGYLRIRLNQKYYELDEEIPFEKNLKNTLELVIDRLVIRKGVEKRLLEAITHASSLAENQVIVALDNEDLFYNLQFSVVSTGKSYPKITPHTFSFNSDDGMCHDCQGLGLRWGANLKTDPTILRFAPIDLFTRLHKNLLSSSGFKLIKECLESEGIDMETPLKELSKEKLDFLFEGSSKVQNIRKTQVKFIGIHNVLIQMAKMGKAHIREEVSPFLSKTHCSSCNGTRLNPLARCVTINNKSIGDVCEMGLQEALDFITKLKGESVLHEAITSLKSRLQFLCEIGLHYLSLNRGAPTLSGGEIQRTRLAKQLGSGLTGALYVLDEPTIALHPHNNLLLNQALKKLKGLGNTLILVEHDPLTIEAADYIFDFGPKSGNLGGEIQARGSLEEIKNNPKSLTGNYLIGIKEIPIPQKRRNPTNYFSIHHASKHNIKNLTLKIPTGVMTSITGVSGSGKSTLIYDILLPALESNLAKRTPKETYEFDGAVFQNLHLFDQIISIDQNPIGRTVRSDVCTYTDLLTPLRGFFAKLPAAAAKGLQPKNFSYNHKAGMCKKCRGLGFQTIELQFMPAAHVECDACHGLRLNPLSLSCTYKGKNLGQILRLTVDQAAEFLPPIPKLTKALNRLQAVGLGYVTLGQETQTLSGGESSRLRLSKELARSTRNHTLYLFDEPTTGLHFDDINLLLPIFHSLVEKKNTLIIIEHNIDIIANSDYVIDIGPDGGKNGGRVIAYGTPEEVAESKASKTAPFLKHRLSPALVKSTP